MMNTYKALKNKVYNFQCFHCNGTGNGMYNNKLGYDADDHVFSDDLIVCYLCEGSGLYTTITSSTKQITVEDIIQELMWIFNNE